MKSDYSIELFDSQTGLSLGIHWGSGENAAAEPPGLGWRWEDWGQAVETQ